MAAGTFTVFDLTKRKMATGGINLAGDSFKVALCGASPALTSAFVGTSTDCRYSDLTEISNGAGYTTGGVAAAATWTGTTTVTFDIADAFWQQLNKTGLKYGVVYDDTPTNKPLIGFMALDTVTTLAPSGRDFTVSWNASGLFTLT